MSYITHQDYVELLRRVERLESFVLPKQPMVNLEIHTADVDPEAVKRFNEYLTKSPRCFFQNLSPEDRNKPMGISCPCNKCSPYSMGG